MKLSFIITKAFLMLFLISSSALATVKIMSLGDSITWDWYYGDARSDAYRHSYRNHLWYKLKAANYDVDFVGSKHNGSAISPGFDGHNEGYTAYTTYQIASLVYSRLVSQKPNIILLHIGTNDSMYSSPYSMTGLESILNEIDRYEQNYDTHITVVLARIIPLPQAGNWVSNFNNSLDTMAASRKTNGDDIIVVNMEVVTSLIDGIHPTNTGYAQMATIWFSALKEVLNRKTEDYTYLIPIYDLILNQ